MSNTCPYVVHATTACFPGFSTRGALAKLREGISEPLLGPLSTAFVQVCPQSMGRIDEAEADALRAEFPEMQLRTHANARVLDRHHLLDASTVRDDTLPYYRALADRCRRFGATATSIHAGYAAHRTLDQMLDDVKRLQDEVFGDVRVAIEGLYPTPARPQLMGTWAEYERVLASGAFLAIDLSHLQIVARADGAFQPDLVRALVASPTTLEIHLSDNDSRRDEHQMLAREPWWWEFLADASPSAVLFSEGNQTRPLKSAHKTVP